MGNPIPVNPCSYTSVEKVLRDILTTTTGPDQRKWTIVGCDGLPFLLASRLIQDKQDLQSILLQPGLGHFEINMTKVLIRLFWEVIGEDLGKMLGYRSPKALLACLSANDHHKSWQMVEILLQGTGDELLVPYVRYALEREEEPTPYGYYKWCEGVKDPNYRFLLEGIFTYALALYLFRVGIRRNNTELMLASRVKFSPLYFGFSKSNYQQIEILDLITRLRAPPDISNFLEDHESLSVSGHPSKGEACDFILEAQNKRAKMWMPPGAPKLIHWNRSCRNLDRFEKIRNNLASMLGLRDDAYDKSVVYHTNLNTEVQQWRATLREAEYLLGPTRALVHRSLSDKLLDKDLVHFSLKCKRNRDLFVSEVCESQVMHAVKCLEPVFILPDDRKHYDAIENKTKHEIAERISEQLADLHTLDYESGKEQKGIWEKEIKTGTKPLLVKFYKDLLLLKEHISNQNDGSDEDLLLADAD